MQNRKDKGHGLSYGDLAMTEGRVELLANQYFQAVKEIFSLP